MLQGYQGSALLTRTVGQLIALCQPGHPRYWYAFFFSFMPACDSCGCCPWCPCMATCAWVSAWVMHDARRRDGLATSKDSCRGHLLLVIWRVEDALRLRRFRNPAWVTDNGHIQGGRLGRRAGLKGRRAPLSSCNYILLWIRGRKAATCPDQTDLKHS